MRYSRAFPFKGKLRRPSQCSCTGGGGGGRDVSAGEIFVFQIGAEIFPLQFFVPRTVVPVTVHKHQNLGLPKFPPPEPPPPRCSGKVRFGSSRMVHPRGAGGGVHCRPFLLGLSGVVG